MTLDELKFAITKQLDEVELLDILNLTIYDLVDILEDYIEEQQEDIAQALG